MKIIGLAGSINSGKSTVAEYLSSAYGYRQTGFGDAIKAEVLRFCRKTLVAHCIMQMPAWNGATPYHHDDPWWDGILRDLVYVHRDAVSRALLQEWGMMRRAKDPDYWVTAWLDSIRDFTHVSNENVRFENEAHAIRSTGGLLVLVERPGLETPHLASDDPTERGLDGWRDWDAVLVNDGTVEDLRRSVDDMMAQTASAGRS